MSLTTLICFRTPQVVQDLGTADIDARLEELLIDGILYAFQEQVRELQKLRLKCLREHGPRQRSREEASSVELCVSCAAQMTEDTAVMLNGFGTVVNSLKGRAKPYLPQICGTIKWRLNNKVRSCTCFRRMSH